MTQRDKKNLNDLYKKFIASDSGYDRMIEGKKRYWIGTDYPSDTIILRISLGNGRDEIFSDVESFYLDTKSEKIRSRLTGSIYGRFTPERLI